MARSDFSEIPRHKDMPASPGSDAAGDWPIVIVGGGPVGLTAAIDLGRRGHKVLLLNQFDFIPGGSKGICYAKRTLDIWNRLGVAEPIVNKGVIWSVGKVFRGSSSDPIYQFDMLPIKDQEMPGFINIQQYWVEEFLVEAVEQLDNVRICWGHEVSGFDQDTNTLTVETDDDAYTISADWILACDGAKSKLRDLLGLEFKTRVFEDNFLIADVKFEAARPAERWFWFDPPWGGASALFHKQPDDVWRLDFQLGWDIDKEAAVRPENVAPYVKGLIGEGVPFTEEWYSIYTFQCGRLDRFVHDRVIFLGDSAHLVSPFGARGFNGGIADVDNLVWKLDAVIDGRVGRDLIETYNEEATVIADENILNSTRSTDFLTPKSIASRAFRDAVLELSEEYTFARPIVNSGRLSTPVSFPQSSQIIPDRDEWSSGIVPGSPTVDVETEQGWLLRQLGDEWKLLSASPLDGAPLPVITLEDDYARSRYGLQDGGVYLIRPDQYVAGRWKNCDLSNDLEGVRWWA